MFRAPSKSLPCSVLFVAAILLLQVRVFGLGLSKRNIFLISLFFVATAFLSQMVFDSKLVFVVSLLSLVAVVSTWSNEKVLEFVAKTLGAVKFINAFSTINFIGFSIPSFSSKLTFIPPASPFIPPRQILTKS